MACMSFHRKEILLFIVVSIKETYQLTFNQPFKTILNMSKNLLSTPEQNDVNFATLPIKN